ncbi:MAG: hypothetical protein KAT43_02130 [Nanoarchaeota archaeon]|nr:hypothetical protein [Nanoarchaeota archaeon]
MGIFHFGKAKEEKPTAPRQSRGYIFLGTIIPKAMSRELDGFRKLYPHHYLVVPTPGDMGSGKKDGKTITPSETSITCKLALTDLPPMGSEIMVYPLSAPSIGTKKIYIVSRDGLLNTDLNQEVICIPSSYVSKDAHLSITLEERAGQVKASILDFGNLRTFLWNETVDEFLRLRAGREYPVKKKAAIAFSEVIPPVVALYFNSEGLYEFARNDCKFR